MPRRARPRADRQPSPGRDLRPARAAKEPGLQRRSRSSLSPSASAPTPRSSRSSTPCCSRPLPYPGSDRLVVLHERLLDSAKPLSVHPVNYVAWRSRARSFEVPCAGAAAAAERHRTRRGRADRPRANDRRAVRGVRCQSPDRSGLYTGRVAARQPSRRHSRAWVLAALVRRRSRRCSDGSSRCRTVRSPSSAWLRRVSESV